MAVEEEEEEEEVGGSIVGVHVVAVAVASGATSESDNAAAWQCQFCGVQRTVNIDEMK